jgi:hypothetical protein
MVEYARAFAKRYPTRRFARFNYASDNVQERSHEAVGGDQAGLRAAAPAGRGRAEATAETTGPTSPAGATTASCRGRNVGRPICAC